MEIGLRPDEGQYSQFGKQEGARRFVCMRMLRFAEIKSVTEWNCGVPTKMNAAQIATAAHRRKS